MLLDGYARHIDWEPAPDLMARAAALLPLLALARVDGASPVEYLTPDQRGQVRGIARDLLAGPALALDTVLKEWMLMAAAPVAGTTHMKEQIR
jgi:hypothetical protein